MVAYSFKRQFVPKIEDGTKCQTIRAIGKRRHARPGETLQLYFGQRSQHCRLIGERPCTSVMRITIDFDTDKVETDQWSIGPARRKNKPRRRLKQLDEFAQMDGFEDWFAFIDFWRAEHFKRRTPTGKWKGLLIKWEAT